MHYYQHHIGDYRRDTSHLSLLEHGVYRQLMDLYYLTESPIPSLEFAIKKIGARKQHEKLAVENILNEFFENQHDGYSHKKCDHLISNFKVTSSVRSEAAKSKWLKNKETNYANAVQMQCKRTANDVLTINHKPITNNHKPKLATSVASDEHILILDSELKKNKSEPETKKLLNYFQQRHSEIFETPILINWGKDGSLAKKMIATFGIDSSLEMVNVFFETNDGFIKKTGYSFGVFFACANKLAKSNSENNNNSISEELYEKIMGKPF